MPDRRKHRGPHPADRQLFAEESWPTLRQAVVDLSWLLSRGYAPVSGLKLVGDRYALTERQRKAVVRSSCSDQALSARKQKQCDSATLNGQVVLIDAFNVLTSVEAALAGGVILHGRDGCFRDMASMHGSYRRVEETRPAIELIGRTLESSLVGLCTWLIDRPVSNSGRLSQMLLEIAAERDWNWLTDLVPDADPVLIESKGIVASADSVVLDGCQRWFNLARVVIESHVSNAYIVPMCDLE